MTDAEFQNGMNLIAAQFDARNYAKARIELIRQESKMLNGDSWMRVVKQLIGECRQPPLLPEFRLAIAAERERFEREQRKKRPRLDFDWQGADPATARENLEKIKRILNKTLKAMDAPEKTQMDFKRIASGEKQ